MSSRITERSFIEHLKRGVKRTYDLMAQVTDYHGKPVTTEYILTSDLAREFMEAGYEVRVEPVYRKLLTAITVRSGEFSSLRETMGSKRADLALVHSNVFLIAAIEIKINVSTLSPLKKDICKITDAFSYIKPTYQKKLIGACLFQVHVPGKDDRWKIDEIRAAFARKIRHIRASLSEYKQQNKSFRFNLVSLQSARTGIFERAVDFDPNLEQETLGSHGHITRYYAIIIKCF